MAHSNYKRFLVLAKLRNGEELELETNNYHKAFRRYNDWSIMTTLEKVRFIDLESAINGDEFSFTNPVN